jgi:hypothetical protein
VWIQFTGLPPHLRGFLIIWDVGSIMVVSKDVDMEFTSDMVLAGCRLW